MSQIQLIKLACKDCKRVNYWSRKNKKLETSHWAENYTNHGIQEIQDFIMPYGGINNTSAVLFNRNVLLKANPFDIPLRFMGDKYAFIKVLSISDVAYVNLPLNYYRAAADSRPKHTDDYLDYFYEQFLIFNWIDKNLKSLDRNKFLKAFKLNIETSLISGWGRKKVKIFNELYRLNKSLVLTAIRNNVQRTLKRAVSASL